MSFQRFRPAPRLTKEQILHIARCKGSFTTSMRYRDEKLDRKCRELVKDGKLARPENWSHYDNREYVLPQKEKKREPVQ